MSTKPKERMRVCIVRKIEPIDVVIDEKGTMKEYTAKEMMGPEIDTWMSLTSGRILLDDDGKPTGMAPAKDLWATLISLSMYDDHDKAVPLEVAKAWPSSAQLQLFQFLQDFNGLTKEAREAEKKQLQTEGKKPRGTS